MPVPSEQARALGTARMSFDEQLHQAFETLADRFRDALASELRRTAADVVTLAQADRDRARQDGAARARAEAEQPGKQQRLLDAVRAMDAAQSLNEIFDALLASVAREVPRVALLIANHGELRTWRFAGFGPEVNQTA